MCPGNSNVNYSKQISRKYRFVFCKISAEVKVAYLNIDGTEIGRTEHILRNGHCNSLRSFDVLREHSTDDWIHSALRKGEN